MTTASRIDFTMVPNPRVTVMWVVVGNTTRAVVDTHLYFHPGMCIARGCSVIRDKNSPKIP